MSKLPQSATSLGAASTIQPTEEFDTAFNNLHGGYAGTGFSSELAAWVYENFGRQIADGGPWHGASSGSFNSGFQAAGIRIPDIEQIPPQYREALEEFVNKRATAGLTAEEWNSFVNFSHPLAPVVAKIFDPKKSYWTHVRPRSLAPHKLPGISLSAFLEWQVNTPKFEHLRTSAKLQRFMSGGFLFPKIWHSSLDFLPEQIPDNGYMTALCWQLAKDGQPRRIVFTSKNNSLESDEHNIVIHTDLKTACLASSSPPGMTQHQVFDGVRIKFEGFDGELREAIIDGLIARDGGKSANLDLPMRHNPRAIISSAPLSGPFGSRDRMIVHDREIAAIEEQGTKVFNFYPTAHGLGRSVRLMSTGHMMAVEQAVLETLRRSPETLERMADFYETPVPEVPAFGRQFTKAVGVAYGEDAVVEMNSNPEGGLRLAKMKLSPKKLEALLAHEEAQALVAATGANEIVQPQKLRELAAGPVMQLGRRLLGRMDQDAGVDASLGHALQPPTAMVADSEPAYA